MTQQPTNLPEKNPLRSDSPEKIQSPYPLLQSILQGLRFLNQAEQGRPTLDNRSAFDARAVFDNRAKAQLFIDIQSREGDPGLWLTPVWRVDHDDLTNSEIIAWGVARYAN